MNPFQDIQNMFVVSLTPTDVVVNLVVAFVCGFSISRCYSIATARPANSRTFIQALVTLAMITAMVIMVIENNLARAFGLVGAMSIIRFRTAVKDVQDIAFIFFSLAIGMAAGVGMTKIAFVATAMIGLTMVGLARAPAVARKNKQYLLQFIFSTSQDSEAPYMPLLNQYCRRYHLINMKTLGPDGVIELSFYAHFRDSNQCGDFVQELGRLEGVRNVNLFFDEEYT